MSERILKALMQLFAIVAKIDVIEESDEIVAADSSKNIVEILLKQDLTSELVVKYLKIFDEFIKERHGTKRAKDSKKKRTSVNSVKVLRICTQINEELYESARIDGANLFAIVKNIIIPLLKPTHIALLILGVIGTLKTFDIIYLTTKGGPARSTEFLSTYIFQKGILEFKASYASTMALMIVVIALILTILQVKGYNRK